MFRLPAFSPPQSCSSGCLLSKVHHIAICLWGKSGDTVENICSLCYMQIYYANLLLHSLDMTKRPNKVLMCERLAGTISLSYSGPNSLRFE